MDTLLGLLSQIPIRPLGTVVHVGAGGTDPAVHAALQARRLVLVDGRDGAIEELRALAAPAGPCRIEPLQAVVAAVAGPLTWNRYNLGWLDGPSDASDLARVYPRLARVAQESRQAVALTELLAGLRVDTATKASSDANVLVLDLPGQEAALLESLDAEALAPFGWIAVRARAGGTDTGSLKAASEQLAAMFYDALPGGAVEDELWPTALFRYAGRRREAALQARVASLEVTLAAGADETRALMAERDQATRLAESRATELAALERHTATLRSEHAALSGQLQILTSQQEAMVAERPKLEALRDAGDSLRHELEAATRNLATSTAQCKAAEDELTSCRAKLQALQTTVADLRADQSRMSATVDALQGTLNGANARADAAESIAAAVRTEKDRLDQDFAAARAARDAALVQVKELSAQLGGVRSELEAARASLADRDVRQRLLDAEIVRAEAQLELVKDVLLREKNF